MEKLHYLKVSMESLVCLGCGITALLKGTRPIKKMKIMVSEGEVRHDLSRSRHNV